MKSIPKLKQSSLQQKFQWIAKPDKYMDLAAKYAPDIFIADIAGAEGSVFINHPEAMRQIITSDRPKFFVSGKETTDKDIGTQFRRISLCCFWVNVCFGNQTRNDRLRAARLKIR